MNSSRSSTAFTLVEMMVVIVIILLLAAVLLPSLSSARKRAMKAASQSQLKGLSNASENYYAAFRAYPGYFTNTVVASTTDNFTPNENIVLSLMGLVDNNTSSSNTLTINSMKVDLDKVGTGPQDKVTGKTYSPFYSAKAEELQVIQGTLDSPNKMPELTDPTSGMPLLMWRINRSGTVPVSQGYGTGSIDLDDYKNYIESTTGLYKTGEDDRYDQKAESVISSSATDRLKNLAWAVIDPRSSDGDSNPNESVDVVNGAYVYISPGPDGIYFSKYDLDEKGIDSTIDKQSDLSNFDDVIEIGGSR